MGLLAQLSESILSLAESWGDGCKASDPSVESVLQHLEHFGYVDAARTSPSSVSDAIRKLQAQAGIAVDGIPGKITARATMLPRCGVREQLVAGRLKWARRVFRCFVESYVPGIEQAEQDRIFRVGANEWARVAEVKFLWVDTPDDADFVLSASSRRSEDFGRRHGVLAWAEMPAGDEWDATLRIKFDEAEIWRSDRRLPGILLRNVWTHELGHALGLGHSTVASALMAPYYSADVGDPVDPDDRSRLVALYGEASGDRQEVAHGYTVGADGAIRLSGHFLTPKG